LVSGGRQSYSFGYLRNVELYDPSTEIWRATGSLRYARSDHTASVLTNGKVLVSGGRARNEAKNRRSEAKRSEAKRSEAKI
jgi:N-acetylneuraminic acid mutarotase